MFAGRRATRLLAIVIHAAFGGAVLLSAGAPARATTPDTLAVAAPLPPRDRSMIAPGAPRRFDAGEALQHDATAHAGDDVLALQRDAVNRMTVAITIDNTGTTRGPFAFLVDTGAERTVIARSVADALGLVPNGRGLLVGMAGTREVDLVSIEQITLGRRSLYGVASPVLDATAIGADGIIGLDGLQGQRILLDFEHNRLALGDAAALGGDRGYDIVVRARRKSGQLIMTDATIDGVRTDVVIDTGSDTSIGNPALARALARGARDETVQLVSVTGQRANASLGLARHMELGGMSINNTLIAFSNAPPFARLGLVRHPALLLGMDQLRLFHRVAIDFAGRRILFDMPNQPTS